MLAANGMSSVAGHGRLTRPRAYPSSYEGTRYGSPRSCTFARRPDVTFREHGAPSVVLTRAEYLTRCARYDAARQRAQERVALAIALLLALLALVLRAYERSLARGPAILIMAGLWAVAVGCVLYQQAVLTQRAAHLGLVCAHCGANPLQRERGPIQAARDRALLTGCCPSCGGALFTAGDREPAPVPSHLLSPTPHPWRRVLRNLGLGLLGLYAVLVWVCSYDTTYHWHAPGPMEWRLVNALFVLFGALTALLTGLRQLAIVRGARARAAALHGRR